MNPIPFPANLPLHLLLNKFIHILIHSHALQSLLILPQFNQLLDLLLREMRPQMPLKLLQYLRLRLLPPQLMPQRRLHNRLLQHRSILQRNRQRIRNRPHIRIVVRACELGVFFAGDALAEGFDERGGGGFAAVGVVGCMQTVEDEHGGDHVLDAVVAVGEVVHGFVLFIDYADAGFVRAADYGVDVGG